MSDRPRVIVLGAAGQLGRQLVSRFQADGEWDVAAYDQDQVDITDAARARDVVADKPPRWVVNAAAMTRVDDCESRATEAYAVNAEGVRHLAEACRDSDSTLVHISTDYVFSGQSPRPYVETDEPDPINVYGKSKWLGERHARGVPHHLIVRTAWLFGPGARNFVDTILRRAGEGVPLRVVRDQFGTPSYAPDVADGVQRLMHAGAEGLFHVTNAGVTTWYELACEAVSLAGIDASIEPVTTEAYPTPATRPANSALDCGKYARTTGHALRDWRSALADYVQLRAELLRKN